MIKKLCIWILLVTLLIVGCSKNAEDQEDKKVVNGFLKEYYSQLTMSFEDWSSVKEDIEHAMTSSNEETIEFGNKFNEFLTEPCLECMISNRLIPNFSMEKSNIQSATIQDLELVNQGEGEYNATYTLKIKKNNAEEDFDNNQEIRIVTVNNKKLIDSIDGKFVWE